MSNPLQIDLRYPNLPIYPHLLHRQKSRAQPPIQPPRRHVLPHIRQLPLINKVCFSLSSKTLFNIFGSIAKRTGFELPRLLDRLNPDLCLPEPGVTRNQLLRLENRRRVFCSQCLRLHRNATREWHPDYFIWGPVDQSKLLKQYCNEFGIVDLCPCISITFRDGKRIRELLRTLSAGTATKQALDRWSHAFKVKADDGNQYLVHECRKRSENVETHIQMTLFIEQPDKLVMQSRYTVDKGRRSDYLLMDPFFACPL